jgi:hypothetical protein
MPIFASFSASSTMSLGQLVRRPSLPTISIFNYFIIGASNSINSILVGTSYDAIEFATVFSPFD